MDKIAICPGSFDPVTLGHIDIIERASKMFSKVIVAVMVNPNKQPSFSINERIDLLKEATTHISNLEIVSLMVFWQVMQRKDQQLQLLRG